MEYHSLEENRHTNILQLDKKEKINTTGNFWNLTHNRRFNAPSKDREEEEQNVICYLTVEATL